jgi:hypothetical protein
VVKLSVELSSRIGSMLLLLVRGKVGLCRFLERTMVNMGRLVPGRMCRRIVRLSTRRSECEGDGEAGWGEGLGVGLVHVFEIDNNDVDMVDEESCDGEVDLDLVVHDTSMQVDE